MSSQSQCTALPAAAWARFAHSASSSAREDVVEAEHALGVLDGCEERRLAATADRERRAVLALQLRVGALERLELVHELVVLRVGDDRRVALVVRVARFVDADREVLHLVGRVGETDALVDVVVHHVDSLGTTPDGSAVGGRVASSRVD